MATKGAVNMSTEKRIRLLRAVRIESSTSEHEAGSERDSLGIDSHDAFVDCEDIQTTTLKESPHKLCFQKKGERQGPRGCFPLHLIYTDQQGSRSLLLTPV